MPEKVRETPRNENDARIRKDSERQRVDDEDTNSHGLVRGDQER